MTPRTAALTAAGVIGAAAAPHLAWAVGASWPAADPAARDAAALPLRLPGRPEQAYGAAGLGMAAIAGHLLAQGHMLPRALSGPATRRITRLVSSGLAARGLLGLLTSTPHVGRRRYPLLDVTVYSPLCLGLAVLVRRAGDHDWS